jgi:hypothetical protein
MEPYLSSILIFINQEWQEAKEDDNSKCLTLKSKIASILF